MESRPHAYSDFVKLGLWQVCFNKYFHHSYQFHHPFTGCHWVHSQEYRPIWEFILPCKSGPSSHSQSNYTLTITLPFQPLLAAWFLAVQGFATTALILTLSSLLLLTLMAAQVIKTGTSFFIRTTAIQNAISGQLSSIQHNLQD
ncbi:hypothetical protein RvY_13973 [Ramazzottius varieornatus]|uniref:Uncharacterized protein n=1 Tax=Ramazzottius varieornatus TaxID=947166 RepID=A0A1D1VRU4_RAMVA|nr:hypothetical protein RvY_13973 [Ramazzottius varieornatus]